MAGITLQQAQGVLDALIAAQLSGACESGALSSVSVGGRTVTFRSLDELITAITFWQTMVTNLERAAAGESRTGYKLARFGRIS
jgi:hypothetical protein